MKKTTFNLNSVLMLLMFAGLVVLYVLFFTSGKNGTDNGDQADTTDMDFHPGTRIVYVNIDTLNAHYEFVQLLKQRLESTGSRLQSEVLGEQSALEKEAADFQRRVSSGSISETQAQRIYEDLMTRQQTLMEKKERYTQQVADQEFDMNIELLDTVNRFLVRYNKIRGYDYIMAYRTAGEILIASDSLDITREVLEQLNLEYNTRKR